MKVKPLYIFGFIMSFAYVFFGMLFVMTHLAQDIISDPTHRKIFGGALVAFGLFRVAYYVRKLRQKS